MISIEVGRRFDRLVELTKEAGAEESVGSGEGMDTVTGLKVLEGIPEAFQIAIEKEEKVVGVLLFLPVSQYEVEVHTVFSKTCRGREAIKYTKMSLEWLFVTSTIERVLANFVRAEHEHVILFGRKVGFRLISDPQDCLVTMELTRDMIITNN